MRTLICGALLGDERLRQKIEREVLSGDNVNFEETLQVTVDFLTRASQRAAVRDAENAKRLFDKLGAEMEYALLFADSEALPLGLKHLEKLLLCKE